MSTIMQKKVNVASSVTKKWSCTVSGHIWESQFLLMCIQGKLNLVQLACDLLARDQFIMLYWCDHFKNETMITTWSIKWPTVLIVVRKYPKSFTITNQGKQLNLCLLLGFCWAGDAVQSRSPASSAAGRSPFPASPTGYWDADVYQSLSAQEWPRKKNYYVIIIVVNMTCVWPMWERWVRNTWIDWRLDSNKFWLCCWLWSVSFSWFSLDSTSFSMSLSLRKLSAWP